MRKRLAGALVTGPEKAHQNALRPSPGLGPVAAPDFAGDHRRTNRLFAPPVGGFQAGEFLEW